MVSIRLVRQGAKKKPQYMIVVIPKTRKLHGAYLEKLGYYFPKAKENQKKVQLDVEKFQIWLKKGAQATPTVKKLFSIAQAQKSA